MTRLPLLALVLALAATGCVSVNETASPDLDEAAVDLDDQLDAPGLLAATAVLYHTSTERYPVTPFDLLGSKAARETGLQNLGLSDLTVSPDGNGVRLNYTLLPTAADPSDRFGSVTVTETDTAGTYTVGLLLERIADPDLSGKALPLAQRGVYNVVRAKGTLCAEVETIRERIAAQDEVGAPPLTTGEAYTVTFTASDGVTSGALREGITVTLPR